MLKDTQSEIKFEGRWIQLWVWLEVWRSVEVCPCTQRVEFASRKDTESEILIVKVEMMHKVQMQLKVTVYVMFLPKLK